MVIIKNETNATKIDVPESWQMKVIPLKANDALLLKPKLYKDERGYFYESFNQTTFSDVTGSNQTFVQDNQSLSRVGVIRGLHFQLPPFEQGKLIRVLSGKILDIFIDIRQNSSTFLVGETVELDSKNHEQLWLPPGFAHGFLALEDNTIVNYKTTNYYSKKCERVISIFDKELKLDFINEDMLISSEKDRNAKTLTTLESDGELL